MRLNYTLPGLLPEVSPASAEEAGDRAAPPFGAHLQRMNAPNFTDWRKLLRLNAPPAGLAGIGPPPPPHGTDLRDGESQRAWWCNMLQKHAGSLEGAAGEAASESNADVDPSVQRMLGWLSESQSREDEIFARHFAEAAD